MKRREILLTYHASLAISNNNRNDNCNCVAEKKTILNSENEWELARLSRNIVN